jgi:hypothetical protein
MMLRFLTPLTKLAGLGLRCIRIVASHVCGFGWIVVAELEWEREVAVRFSDAEKKIRKIYRLDFGLLRKCV